MKKKARKRPDWDAFYLAQAFLVSDRALDPDTQHGCVIVSKDNIPLSSACNGPLSGSIDEEIPMERPDKYPFMIHAEENTLIFYYGSKSDIEGATAYISGRPCHRCLRMLIQKGIRRFVYTDLKSACVDTEDIKNSEKLLALRKNKDVKVEMYPHKEKIIEVFENRLQYIKERVTNA